MEKNASINYNKLIWRDNSEVVKIQMNRNTNEKLKLKIYKYYNFKNLFFEYILKVEYQGKIK